MVISFPAAFRKAFVHRTLRGLRFILIASAINLEKINGNENRLEVLVTSAAR